MKAVKLIVGLITIFVQLPIWWFLIYSILNAIHPDRLVWFMFFTYIPIQFLMAIITTIIEKSE
jgi:hypothetical protein